MELDEIKNVNVYKQTPNTVADITRAQNLATFEKSTPKQDRDALMSQTFLYLEEVN